MTEREWVGAAIVSPDEKYRFTLKRTYVGNHLFPNKRGTVLWVMLNPSTADALQDDPTVRRCMKFSFRWGYHQVSVCNLFAFRATNPGVLRTTEDPVGERNDMSIRSEMTMAQLIILAWGNHGKLHGRGAEVAKLAQMEFAKKTWCLGLTKLRHPRHPLYVRGDTTLVKPW